MFSPIGYRMLLSLSLDILWIKKPWTRVLARKDTYFMQWDNSEVERAWKNLERLRLRLFPESAQTSACSALRNIFVLLILAVKMAGGQRCQRVCGLELTKYLYRVRHVKASSGFEASLQSFSVLWTSSTTENCWHSISPKHWPASQKEKGLLIAGTSNWRLSLGL